MIVILDKVRDGRVGEVGHVVSEGEEAENEEDEPAPLVDLHKCANESAVAWAPSGVVRGE